MTTAIGISRVVLLDANNLAMRSYHAAKDSMSVGGVSTGPLQLFVNSLSRFLRDERPTHFVACWDGGGSSYREAIYPQYKEARRALQVGVAPHGESFRLIKEFLTISGLAQWAEHGVEADDLIAAAHRRHPGQPMTILSSDKDLLQLLDDTTEQIRFSSSGAATDRWTKARIIADLGYRPDQIPLMMALTGDTSDGIPGVFGIGPKKAFKLLQDAEWDLERVLVAHPEWNETVRLSEDLVDLTRVPVEVPEVPVFAPLAVDSPDALARLEALTEFCARWQLQTIWDRIVNRTLWWS